MLDEDPERAQALIELEDRILERALAGERDADQRRRGPRALRRPEGGARPARGARGAQPRTAAATRPPTSRSSRRSAASAPAATTSRSASPSTTPCATSSALEDLVREEVDVLMERLAGEMDPDEAWRADRGRRPAAQRPDRRDAHQADGRRAGAPARLRARLERQQTPASSPRWRELAIWMLVVFGVLACRRARRDPAAPHRAGPA